MERFMLLQWGVALTVTAVVVSYALARIGTLLARQYRVMDAPTGGRKIHANPTPLWGGVGIALTIAALLGLFFSQITSLDIRPMQLIGYLIGVGILLIGGMIDDRRPLSPRIQIIFPVCAALAVILSGTGIIQVTNPFERGGLSLVWGEWAGFSFPSDLLTFVWILVATYAMKILDGLDGLVTGMTVIGAGIVGALGFSAAYYQPSVVLLSTIVGGAYLGFLPRNINPAKQFLGEAGSTIAGFSLAVLAILSGTKIAIALSVLAIPIADALLVVLGRVRRGQAWYTGDATHLHHRLIQAGVPQRIAVLLYWGVALAAGIFALSLQTRGKIFLIVFLAVFVALASFAAGHFRKRS